MSAIRSAALKAIDAQIEVVEMQGQSGQTRQSIVVRGRGAD